VQKKVIHPAWIVAGITFATLFATSGFRSAPSVLILPLERKILAGSEMSYHLQLQ
jgi:hypothetical protein